MGGSTSKEVVPKKEIIKRLSSKDKANFKLHFETLSGTNDLKLGKIPKEIFINEYLVQRFPKLCHNLLERFYIVLSNKKKEFIVWDEFLQSEYLFSFTPNESIIVEAKNADEFDTDYDIILQHRKLFLFNVMDLNFDGKIDFKEFKQIMSLIIQDKTIKTFDENELKTTYDDGLDLLGNFMILEFDRTNKNEGITKRDFNRFIRYDESLQNLLNMLRPPEEEFGSLVYGRIVARTAKKSRDKLNKKTKKANK